MQGGLVLWVLLIHSMDVTFNDGTEKNHSIASIDCLPSRIVGSIDGTFPFFPSSSYDQEVKEEGSINEFPGTRLAYSIL